MKCYDQHKRQKHSEEENSKTEATHGATETKMQRGGAKSMKHQKEVEKSHSKSMKKATRCKDNKFHGLLNYQAKTTTPEDKICLYYNLAPSSSSNTFVLTKMLLKLLN